MASISLANVDIEFNVEANVARTLKSTAFDLFRPKRRTPRIIHALKSVCINIEHGEKVGIIGPNGAGKSTLLKVIAGIYHPKRGEVNIQGHICPLFEFATGFEMDATGWDNIRIRALLLGLSQREIDQKIEEIAEFCNLGEFLDMPVRHYSSGMLLRLAFATSTALEPEILLLDEVMAAGDAAFIDKAKKRMDELIMKASIVVFVSHSMSVVRSFCDRTLWLNSGEKVLEGPTQEVVEAYENSVKGQG